MKLTGLENKIYFNGEVATLHWQKMLRIQTQRIIADYDARKPAVYKETFVETIKAPKSSNNQGQAAQAYPGGGRGRPMM